MKIKNQCEKLIAIVLTVSIIATSFLLVVQISAQTEEGTFIQAAQVTTLEDDRMQTPSRPADPAEKIVISNEDDFSEFMTSPEFWESKYKVTLTCDIDIKGKTFNPIKEFNGVFDGCGHTVSNLNIQNKSGKGKNVEFAFINTLNEFAKIKNVTLDNYTIEGNSYIRKAAGFIVTNHGTISGVDIINSSMNNIDKKVKSAGFVLNNEEDGIIENCFLNMNTKDSKIRSGFVGTNYGKITKSSTTLSVNSKDIAGGFVSENQGTIEKCSFKGDVSSRKCAGGFCGSNSGEITSCKSEGNVTAKTKLTKLATICGGFIGENSGIIKESGANGKVEGQEFTGGFAGINNDKGEIISCKATCDVKSHTYVASIYCGGFVGLGAGKMENCTFNGAVDGCVDCEKVLGGVVAAVVGVAFIATLIYLLVKNYRTNAEIKKAANKCKYNCDLRDDYNLLTSIGDDNPGVINEIKKSVTSVLNSDNEFANVFNSSNLENLTSNLSSDEFVNRFTNKYYNNLIDNCKRFYENKGRILKNEDFEQLIKECNNRYFKVYYLGLKSKGVNSIEEVKKTSITAFSDFLDTKRPLDDSNLYNEAIFTDNIIDNFNKTFIISLTSGLILALIGGTASGITIRETFGRKCAYVAGFCGFNIGEIIGCRANINSFKAKTLYNKHNMCGGFVGINGETGTIKDCSATGNEIHNKTYTGGHLGGFVGENTGKIESGTTTVPVTNGKCTGGFCGNNSGEISGSKSEGNATANAKTVETKCGGFVGNNEKGKIDDCTSTGSVTGQEYVGGFAGANKSKISTCNATGKATAKTKTNTACAGGFVGENEKGTIISCTAIGGVNSQSSSGQAKAGGFVGINKANIMSSKASGYVYLSAGTFYKDDGCGGFVGKNDQVGSIDGCYAEAIVETTNKKKGGGFVGEAVSKSTIKTSKCKAKIITKAGVKSQTKFYQDKDKKAVLESCYVN